MGWAYRKCKCERCEHGWWPRSPEKKPVLCPSCKSKYWDDRREDKKAVKK